VTGAVTPARRFGRVNMENPLRTARATVCHINLARGYRGGERQTELLIRALADKGWKQRLVARRGEPLAERICGVDALTVVESSPAWAGAVRSIGRPGLIHVHEGRSLRTAWINHLITGTPYLVTRRIQKGPRQHWLNRCMYRQADRVVALSAAIAEKMAAFDPSLSVEIIPSAISGLSADPSESATLRARWGGQFVVGHIGALDDSHKGQQQIVATAEAMASAHPEMRFVLVGGGPDEARLQEASRRLPSLILEGQTDRVADYLGAFDVFLFPSRHEGLGSILLDALDFGLPVVATRVGGIPEVIEEGVNGFLVSVDDIGGMQDALAALAADRDLRARLGAAGRETARAFTREEMADQYAALYGAIMRSQGIDTG
jgi:glycosyltransferase involved in cell wall biosynthesis